LETIEMSYAHFAPGEYSEIYVSVQGLEPGTAVRVILNGPAVDQPGTKTVNADDNGLAYFVFRIFQFGPYTANVTVNDSSTSRSIAVSQ
jgi:hypothetical protein